MFFHSSITALRRVLATSAAMAVVSEGSLSWPPKWLSSILAPCHPHLYICWPLLTAITVLSLLRPPLTIFHR